MHGAPRQRGRRGARVQRLRARRNPAYGVETIWEDSLMAQPELYFEAGDHEHLVRVKAKDFIKLLPNCPHGQISRAR
jgi:hypothetical protein